MWLKKTLFFFLVALFLVIYRGDYAKYQDEFLCAPFKKMSIEKFVSLGHLN